MPYPQRYAWALRFDENWIVVQVRPASSRSSGMLETVDADISQAKAYLDSALVQKAYDANS